MYSTLEFYQYRRSNIIGEAVLYNSGEKVKDNAATVKRGGQGISTSGFSNVFRKSVKVGASQFADLGLQSWVGI